MTIFIFINNANFFIFSKAVPMKKISSSSRFDNRNRINLGFCKNHSLV